MIINSPLLLPHIILFINHENLVLDQDTIFSLIIFCILITCLLDKVWTFLGEVTCLSFLRVRGLRLGYLSFQQYIPQ